MSDTKRVLSALIALLPNNSDKDISAQDVRDFLVSVYANVNLTTVAGATHSVAADDVVLHVTYTATGSVAITVPTAQLDVGRLYYVKDAGFNCATNNIVITPQSGNIEDESSATMNLNGTSLTFYTDGTDLFIL